MNGTSFSAPYISHLLSHLDELYNPINSETLKAILLSSCEIRNKSFKLIEKRDSILNSNNNKNILLYSEGNLNLKQWDPNIRKFRLMKDKIRFYVPKNVKEIRLVLVHSDNYKSSLPWSMSAYVKTEIHKGGRISKLNYSDAEAWTLNEKTNVQFALFKPKKSQTDD